MGPSIEVLGLKGIIIDVLKGKGIYPNVVLIVRNQTKW